MRNDGKINFFETLGVISAVLFLAGPLFYLAGLIFYLIFNIKNSKPKSDDWFDFIWNNWSTGISNNWFDFIWIPIIIAFPFIIQFIIFFRFYMKSRADEELSVLFNVYSTFMCIALSLYSFIWCIYNITLLFNPEEKYYISLLAWILTSLSLLSVICILFLVGLILKCTRIITRDIFEKNEGLFKTTDLNNEEYEKLRNRLGTLLNNWNLLQNEAELEQFLNGEKKDGRKIIDEICESFSLDKRSDAKSIFDFLTDKNQPVQIKPLRRVLKFLSEDNHFWIRDALNSKSFRSVPKLLLIRSFNKILRNPWYYDQKEFSTKDAETRVKSAALYFKKNQEGLLFTEQVQLENRNLFDEHIIKVLSKQSQNSDNEDIQQDNKELIFIRIFNRSSNLLKRVLKLGLDDHINLKIKQGIARFPFDIMSFFFTVFLCITYLFGFSFAFHDRSNLLSDKTKTPALFMDADYLDKKSNSPAASVKAPNKQQTFFLFYEPSDAGIKTENSTNSNTNNAAVQNKNNTTNANSDTQYLQSARSTTNLENFNGLLKTIKEVALRDKRVYVEVVGRADDVPVSKEKNTKQTYSSNYELSLARSQNLKFELIRGLQESPDVLEKIEWICLPVSNDESLGSDYPLNDPSHRPSIVLNNSPVNENSSPKKAAANPKDLNKEIRERIDKAAAAMKDTDGNTDLGENDKLLNIKTAFLKNEVELAKKLFSEGQINDGRDGQALVSNLQRSFILYNSMVEQAKTKENIGSDEYKRTQESFELLKKNIEDALNFYQSGANSANKRITEVYITSTPENDFTVSSVKLNLLDYILYSITSIGYGDIKPTTMYAKFLCILVTIIELFFLVVFFNVLMSVKRVNNEDDLIASSY